MDQQIDTAAEVDKTKFWKMVNPRRKKSESKMNGGIIFHGTVVRDRDEQLQGWGNFFENLYKPSALRDFDEQFLLKTSSAVERTLLSTTTDPNASVSPEVIENIINRGQYRL
ncbi:hypothetical protein DPMN_140572 [Dreissena polymorpha]|uniref:Uncharacterized protein n=1 Tax=Dreissena polymorpha TaxID=45954 RepID=A0A9D4JJ50_DREPO|nr:hypothetical protein DPMN_140572 [Dreissena polymorpha]